MNFYARNGVLIYSESQVSALVKCSPRYLPITVALYSVMTPCPAMGMYGISTANGAVPHVLLLQPLLLLHELPDPNRDVPV